MQVSETQPNSDANTVIGDEANGDYSELPIKIGLIFVDVDSGTITISEFNDDERRVSTTRPVTCLAPSKGIVEYSAMCKLSGCMIQSVDRGMGAKAGLHSVRDSVLIVYFLHTVNNEDVKRIMQRLSLHPSD